MKKHQSRTKLIDMTLRMWSKDVNLKTYLDQAGEDPQSFHVSGQPIVNANRSQERVAKRHFASV